MTKKKKNKSKKTNKSNKASYINKHDTIKDSVNATNKEIEKVEALQELKKDGTTDDITNNTSNNEENINETVRNKDSETSTIDIKNENNSSSHQNEDTTETVEESDNTKDTTETVEETDDTKDTTETAEETDNTKDTTDNKDTKQHNENNTDDIDLDTSNKTDNENTNKNYKGYQKEQSKKESLEILKDKRVITACALTALTSSLVSIMGTNLVIKNKLITNNDVAIENVDSTASVTEIGNKLEEEKLIDSKSMFTLDYTFDSRFELFKDNILEIYTKVSNSDENFQEVFIIKSDDTNKVEEHLKTYKESLITKYKNNSTFKTALSIVKDATIKSEKGITYFIASNKKADIEKVITNEINI